ncbi:MAG: ribosome biogenesis protein ytm1 [Thelocarpon impressellum]|nr:MAG: ribosome biogenesis protein ytm1 [Thelocarpon impressellum]
MTSDAQLGQAVLRFVRDVSYPDSEEVISATLPPTAFKVALNLIEDARKDVKEEIGELSRGSAGDIDGWIAQAKKLHIDIERSKATAQDIVRHAEEGRRKQERVDDSAGKKRLLQDEVAFNETLVGTLEVIQAISAGLDSAQEAAVENKMLEAIEMLDVSDARLGQLSNFDNTRPVKLIRQRSADLHRAVDERLDEFWDALMVVNRPEQRITLKHQIQRGSTLDVHVVIQALDKLQHLDSKIDRLYQALDDIILSSRLGPPVGKTVAAVGVKGDDIQITGRQDRTEMKQLFDDLYAITEYLSTRLPPSITIPLSQTLMPSLTLRLINAWLTPCVPSSLDGLSAYQELLEMVVAFIGIVESLEWKGTSQLKDWVENAPRVWLVKRRTSSLDQVRTILAGGLGEKKTMERIETQKVERDEGMLAANGEDDWNANWSDNEGDGVDGDETRTNGKQDEEDVSDWDLNAPADEPVEQPKEDAAGDEDGVEEAWGWGEDNDTQDGEAPPPSPRKGSKQASQKSNGHAPRASPKERELTLREKYTVTAIPEAILATIRQVVQDAETLSDPRSADVPIAPAAAGLFALPTLTLAMFRASAPFYYRSHSSGSMHLYNDSLWLGEQLRALQADHSGTPAGKRLKLDGDATALEDFGKRAYAKEMEAQRTVIRDLLDGAQGFANCTTAPFAEACDAAITGIVERISLLAREWSPVLSRSALLQSLGSLLGTATAKLVVDIEDMADISEPESQALATYCARLAALETHFAPPSSSPPSPDTPTEVPLTALYVPTWLRFQYLAQILESSLADIRYLWSEGELALEMGADEVVDLILALFAESEHRRRAVSEIRRSARGL